MAYRPPVGPRVELVDRDALPVGSDEIILGPGLYAHARAGMPSPIARLAAGLDCYELPTQH